MNNLLNKKFSYFESLSIVLFTLIYLFFEINYFNIEDLYNFENDFERLGIFLNLTNFHIIFLNFIPLVLGNLLIFSYFKKFNHKRAWFVLYLFLFKFFITSILFYYIRIYSVSRLKIIILFLIYSLLIYFLFYFLTQKKLYLFMYLIIFSVTGYAIVQYDIFYEYKFNNCINTYSNNSQFSSFNEDKESIFVIGHAYGSHLTKELGLSLKVLNMIENEKSTKDSTLVLTGDIVLNNSIESMELVKKQISNNFKKYLIAPGNHDVRDNNNYYQVFREDLFFEETDHFLLISANFSTNNWEPSDNNKIKINNFIKNSKVQNIFLFSHQLFWLEDINNEISPNGRNLLEGNLKKDSLNWLESEQKNIIVISGDYGGMGQDSYCKKINSNVFIANGIGDHENDSFIKIVFNKNGFYVRKVNF